MKAIAVIPARLDSRRLPQKALTTVLGKPLISYALERASQIPSLSAVVLATTERPIDDPLAEYGRSAGVPVFRGPAENVAQRCVQCARAHRADFFVRLNGDSPFPDPVLVAGGMEMLSKNLPADLITNLIGRSFPYGISVEIVNVDTLDRILPTLDHEESEHVTKRFYDQPREFAIHRMSSAKPELRHARLVVDTPEDLRTFRAIAERFGPRMLHVSYDEVAQIYLSHYQKTA
jgi:spore coat polysaccharide biosynthesis protein SpsF